MKTILCLLYQSYFKLNSQTNLPKMGSLKKTKINTNKIIANICNFEIIPFISKQMLIIGG